MRGQQGIGNYAPENRIGVEPHTVTMGQMGVSSRTAGEGFLPNAVLENQSRNIEVRKLVNHVFITLTSTVSFI